MQPLLWNDLRRFSSMHDPYISRIHTAVIRGNNVGVPSYDPGMSGSQVTISDITFRP
jgi:hypothetical protein